MSSRIFIDTGFIIALINQRDQYHLQASKLAEQLENHLLLTTDAVMLEISNSLSRNFKRESIEIIEQFLASEEVEVIHLAPQLFDKAFALYKAYQDKQWGLVDCISFVVMQEAEVTQVLTFDRHFKQAGFQVLL